MLKAGEFFEIIRLAHDVPPLVRARPIAARPDSTTPAGRQTDPHPDRLHLPLRVARVALRLLLLLLLLVLLAGAVMAVGAACGSAQRAVMTGEMAGNAADDGALDAALG